MLKNAGVLAPAFFFMGGFSFSLCREDSKFMAMKVRRIYFSIVFFILTPLLYGLDYDLSLFVEIPPTRYGRSLENGIMFQPGITIYPRNGPWYVSSIAGAGPGWTDMLLAGGVYYSSGKHFFRPEIAIGWAGRPDSLTSSLKITVNRFAQFPWSVSVDGDFLSGRLYSRGEIQKHADWIVPWIITGYAAVNLTDYSMGKYRQPAGLADAGLGITTWAEVGSYYAELSLFGGPSFRHLNYDTFIFTLRFLLIWSRGGA